MRSKVTIDPQNREALLFSSQERLGRKHKFYSRLLYKRLQSRWLSFEDTEDVVSDLLLRLAELSEKSLPSAVLANEKRLNSWFVQACWNHAIDRMRKQVRQAERVGIDSSDAPATHLDSALPAFEISEQEPSVEQRDPAAAYNDDADRLVADIQQALKQLPPEEAEVLRIRRDMPKPVRIEECARMAGINRYRFERLHARGWKRLVQALIDLAPSQECVEIRELAGRLESDEKAAEVILTKVRRHERECASCRAFHLRLKGVLGVAPITFGFWEIARAKAAAALTQLGREGGAIKGSSLGAGKLVKLAALAVTVGTAVYGTSTALKHGSPQRQQRPVASSNQATFSLAKSDELVNRLPKAPAKPAKASTKSKRKRRPTRKRASAPKPAPQESVSPSAQSAASSTPQGTAASTSPVPTTPPPSSAAQAPPASSGGQETTQTPQPSDTAGWGDDFSP